MIIDIQSNILHVIHISNLPMGKLRFKTWKLNECVRSLNYLG